MKSLPHIRNSWWTALMAGLFLVSASFAFRYVSQERDRGKRLEATLRNLQDLQTDSRRQLEQLHQWVDGPVRAPGLLFAEWVDAGRLSVSGSAPGALPEGFRHHQIRLQLREFPPEDLSALLTKAESASPPWRLRALNLSAAGGKLQGELLMEALDKSSSEL